MDISGRSIVLTGAGSGIGRALALQLADRSVRLTLVGRRAAPLQEVAEHVRERGSRAQVVSVDLTAPGAPTTVVDAAQRAFGSIDVLVNNAGNVRAGRLESLSETEVLAQIALNLTAPILLARAALPALRASGRASGQASGDALVVNVSSGIGLVAVPFYATYAATKAGVAHFGDALRRELAGEGVRVLNVYPGATSTPMMDSSSAGAEHGFEYESPEDVAAAVLAGIGAGELRVVRGGQARRRMIALDREDPAAVDAVFAARKEALERAVTAHSSL